MFEKVNPYLKEELSNEAVAHACGCRCRSGTGTVGAAITIAIDRNDCYATCIGDTNGNANYLEAYSDRSWS